MLFHLSKKKKKVIINWFFKRPLAMFTCKQSSINWQLLTEVGNWNLIIVNSLNKTQFLLVMTLQVILCVNVFLLLSLLKSQMSDKALISVFCLIQFSCNKSLSGLFRRITWFELSALFSPLVHQVFSSLAFSR